MKKQTLIPILPYVVATVFLFLAFCTRTTLTDNDGGSGSTTTNGVVATLYNEKGAPAKGASWKLRYANYVSPLSAEIPVDIKSSLESNLDANGKLKIDSVNPGSYILEVNDNKGFSVAMPFTVHGDGSIITLHNDTLRPDCKVTGTLPVAAQGGNSWFAQIYGLERLATVDKQTGTFTFPHVPAGSFAMRLIAASKDSSFIFIDTVFMRSGDSVVVHPPYAELGILKKIMLNTTLSGGQVAGNVYRFPVLIRLRSNNFDFAKIKQDASDLWFTKSDNTPLAFEIERWDSVQQLAEVWVNVDTVFGNDSLQYINLKSLVASQQLTKSNNVFDTAQGFQGVWHLGEDGNTLALDATVNKYGGTPNGMTNASKGIGIIGCAQQFNGTSSFIQMKGTGSSKLNFTEGGIYSVSAWVCVDSPATRPGLIVGKGHSQYYVRLNNYSNNNYWEFVEDHDLNKQQNITDIPALAPYEWKHIVGVRQGDHQYLYVNGELVMDTIRMHVYNLGITARDTTYDVSIGKHMEVTTEGDCFFKGKIDEVRISNKACTADWIRLCYMNQRPDDKLVVIQK